MKWPWVNRKKLDDTVAMWLDAYRRALDDVAYWTQKAKEFKGSADYWKTRWYREVKEAQGADTQAAVDTAGTSWTRISGSRFMREVRPVPAHVVPFRDPMDTGRVDGEAAPGGTAPGRKS